MITLIIPDEIASQLGRESQQPLTLTTDHPASSYGIGALLDADGEVLDGAGFRHLRDTLGVKIKVTQPDLPEAVCAALGVPGDEPGIFMDGATAMAWLSRNPE